MLKILIVDDEPTVRRGIMLGVDWASMDSVVVGEASNGEEGLIAVEEYNPTLVISDVRMPKMDGIEMVTKLRESGYSGHIIMLTAYSDFEYVRSALQLGADDYLLKPFRDEELRTAIEKINKKEKHTALDSKIESLEIPNGEKSKYVKEAMDYIAKHYSDRDISITTISLDLGVSEGHLSHIFKKETGYTVINYLTRYRMHCAMELLKDCRNRVYEVAEKVGYTDVTYFSSTFKKLLGMSPSEYQTHIN